MEKGEPPEPSPWQGNSNLGGQLNCMSILTPFNIPCTRPFCGGKFHKHGKRKRHVIERGKIWYFVQRLRCSVCRCTRTLLQPNMLPHKHYAALEIEQVLQQQEEPAASLHECGAEESTLRRWMREIECTGGFAGIISEHFQDLPDCAAAKNL